MNTRFALLCAAVLICLGNSALAVPQGLPGGDPIVSCVSPAIRIQVEDWGNRGNPRLPEFYPDVVKAVTCIVKSSPLTRDENGFTVLPLRATGDAAVADSIGVGNIGPHWISLKQGTTVLRMQGMVYIGGNLKGDCTWQYEVISESFKGLSGAVNCVRPGGKEPIGFESRFSKAWLKTSFYDFLEDVLRDAIRIHEDRYRER